MRIASVADGSPASAAGLQVGDRVIAAGGRSIRNRLDWDAYEANLVSSGPVTFEVTRGDRPLSATLTLPRVSENRRLTSAGATLTAARSGQFVTLLLALLVIFLGPSNRTTRTCAWLLASVAVFSVTLPYGFAAYWRELPRPAGLLLWLPHVSSLAVTPIMLTFFAGVSPSAPALAASRDRAVDSGAPDADPADRQHALDGLSGARAHRMGPVDESDCRHTCRVRRSGRHGADHRLSPRVRRHRETTSAGARVRVDDRPAGHRPDRHQAGPLGRRARLERICLADGRGRHPRRPGASGLVRVRDPSTSIVRRRLHRAARPAVRAGAARAPVDRADGRGHLPSRSVDEQAGPCRGHPAATWMAVCRRCRIRRRRASQAGRLAGWPRSQVLPRTLQRAAAAAVDRRRRGANPDSSRRLRRT